MNIPRPMLALIELRKKERQGKLATADMRKQSAVLPLPEVLDHWSRGSAPDLSSAVLSSSGSRPRPSSAA